MKDLNASQNYRQLLLVRRSAYRRNLMLSGGVFLLAVLATVTIGLVFGLGGRQVYLILAADLAFGMWFGESWVRLLVVESNLELLANV